MADGVNQRHCGEFFSVCQHLFSLLRSKLVITARLSVSGLVWLFRIRFVRGKNGFQDFSVSKFFTRWSPRVKCVKFNVQTVLRLSLMISISTIVFVSYRVFDSIIRDLAEKLEVDDSLICKERMEEPRKDHTTSVKDKTIKICSVCGDYASGFHYKCWTCDGCKVNDNTQFIFFINS